MATKVKKAKRAGKPAKRGPKETRLRTTEDAEKALQRLLGAKKTGK